MKKKRLNIQSLEQLKEALREEGYEINTSIKRDLSEVLKINDESLSLLENSEIIYRASNVKNLVNYLEEVTTFGKEHNKLCKILNNVKEIKVERIEYHREPSPQENVEHIEKAINSLSCNISTPLNEKELNRFQILENELEAEHLYAKDIELLKKILIYENSSVEESYNEHHSIKTLSLKIPRNIGANYIKPDRGSVEYHQHISSHIPRIKRLRKNLYNYLEEQNGIHILNQSNALLDSMNIAYATYEGKEFKALSGDVNVLEYCNAPSQKEASFESVNVNRLGMVGTGYTRENDSEKKILEEIHSQIKEKILSDDGELTLYTKWEPCPSCYYVLSQFCEAHPNIKVQIKYNRKYGNI